jgi:hypothetical protein
VKLVFSWKAHALVRREALVMELVPNEVGTCKGRCLPNLYVHISGQAGKGWCLWFGACGDCCLQVIETRAALIVVLYVGMGAGETY